MVGSFVVKWYMLNDVEEEEGDVEEEEGDVEEEEGDVEEEEGDVEEVWESSEDGSSSSGWFHVGFWMIFMTSGIICCCLLTAIGNTSFTSCAINPMVWSLPRMVLSLYS